ncbi:MAG: hypothetical protein KDD84_23015, partial [Caldilineaceae bacterium]|nr:hypothetical protein [Caldilineaceae bacterium]
ADWADRGGFFWNIRFNPLNPPNPRSIPRTIPVDLSLFVSPGELLYHIRDLRDFLVFLKLQCAAPGLCFV